MPVDDEERYERACAAIDTANADDPERLLIEGREVPKEPTHSAMAVRWVERLRPDPPEALLLAARAHHIRRWQRPRDDYPRDRQGYLRWRSDLQDFHAEKTGEILREAGYDGAMVERVGTIIRKRGLGHDEDVQTFEDALSLVFLETQLHEFGPTQPEAKVVNILRRTWRKMSPEARAAAAAFEFGPAEQKLIEAATSQ